MHQQAKLNLFSNASTRRIFQCLVRSIISLSYDKCVSQLRFTPRNSPKFNWDPPSLRVMHQSFKRSLSLPVLSHHFSVRALRFISSISLEYKGVRRRRGPVPQLHFCHIRSLRPHSFLEKTTRRKSGWKISLQVLM